MSGWVPTPADGWPEIAEALTTAGVRWPTSAAITDLRWHIDREGGRLHALGVGDPTAEQLVRAIPGRPTLAARWGWTDHAVRAILRGPATWWDGLRWGAAPERTWSEGGRRPNASPVDRQYVASTSPVDRQSDNGPTGTLLQESPVGRQSVASRPPVDRHTRVESPSPSPTPSPPPAVAAEGQSGPERTRADAPAGPPRLLEVPEASIRLLGLWQVIAGAISATFPQNTKCIPHRPGSASVRMLTARANEHGPAAAESVLDWYRHAPDAEWFRQNVGLSALMRPQKFPEWLDRAEAWKRARKPEPAECPPVPAEPEPPRVYAPPRAAAPPRRDSRWRPPEETP